TTTTSVVTILPSLPGCADSEAVQGVRRAGGPTGPAAPNGPPHPGIYSPPCPPYLSIRITEYVDFYQSFRGRGPDAQPVAATTRASRVDGRGVVCGDAAAAVDDQSPSEGAGGRGLAGGPGGWRTPVLPAGDAARGIGAHVVAGGAPAAGAGGGEWRGRGAGAGGAAGTSHAFAGVLCDGGRAVGLAAAGVVR